MLAFAAYLGLSLTGEVAPWWGIVAGDGPVELFGWANPGGPVGSAFNVLLHMAFGSFWCWAFPVLLAVAGSGCLISRQASLKPWILRAVPLWLVTTAWIAQPGGPASEAAGARLGGLAGFYLSRGFHGLFGLWGGRIFLTLFLLVAATLLLRPWLGWLPGLLGYLGRAGGSFLEGLRDLWRLPREFAEGVREKLAARREQGSAVNAGAEPERTEADPPEPESLPVRERVLHNISANDDPFGSAEDLVDEPLGADELPEQRVLPGAAGDYEGEELPGATSGKVKPRRKTKRRSGPVVLPPIDLLTPAGAETQPVSPAELDASADLLESTLRSFGVEGEVKDVRPGPVVTTFEYQPGSGIRVNQIVQRSDDLALAMRARSIRMEAPIPGKAAVGIEIPNPKARMVRLREVLEATGNAPREPLSVVLGNDVVGRPVSIDIAALPHLLVAGSTGSGKSVCLNALICNLIMRNDPSSLRMVLIDPKMLEMNVYNGIPHLLLPVVTDPREALKALQWMVAQMEFRYRQLSKHAVRNIQQYNAKIARGEVQDSDGETVTEPMPYYLTIVDELADLMLQLGNEIEGPITRLAQKARAVGIHLILATQRPSVDVLTGVIKANIPCRIAFRVIQKNDSRTVLDMNGAEQLLGHGDMLYLQPGRALPVRVHGSFIDVDECEAIAAHWHQYAGTTEEISLNESPSGGGMHTGEDDLFDEARQVVVLHQSGSTSLLQRRLRIGYTRAGRLMDMLEEAGVVGPFTGSKARDVLIKPEDLPEMQEGEA
jgi:S-DNA-T family DNA segregation ATPase FtsK/SpoIIIE